MDAFHGNALNAANKLLIGVYPSSQLGEEKAAIDILLFGIRCGSDITDNYTLLVPLLKETNDSSSLTEVYQKLATLPEGSRKRIKEKLS